MPKLLNMLPSPGPKQTPYNPKKKPRKTMVADMASEENFVNKQFNSAGKKPKLSMA